MNTLLEVLAALGPPVGVGLLFWFAMRAIVQADRRERQAVARLDAEDDARRQREQHQVPGQGTAGPVDRT